eukprot:5845372-Pleurochrysis_carterae.AAC.1
MRLEPRPHVRRVPAMAAALAPYVLALDWQLADGTVRPSPVHHDVGRTLREGGDGFEVNPLDQRTREAELAKPLEHVNVGHKPPLVAAAPRHAASSQKISNPVRRFTRFKRRGVA